MNINRRNFCFMLTASAAASAFTGCASTGSDAIVVDDKLTAFLSDIHVSGWNVKGQPTYQNPLFEKAVNDVLALRPRPKRVVILGDIALWRGLKEDYAASAPMLKRLEDAGIELTITTGNHDHRRTMLEAHPRYAKTSPVPGRIVSVVDLGDADLLVLDSLQESASGEGNNAVDGTLDKAQQDWLADTAKSAKRPFFVCAHHPPQELSIGKEKLISFFDKVPLFAGYIHGHDHRWYKRWHHVGYSKPHVLRELCIPSTGWWGTIGFALFRSMPHEAVVSLEQKDFFFPRPLKPGEARPLEWDDILAEDKGDTCKFRF